TYEELNEYTGVDISGDRNDKEYFFDLFSLPTISEENPHISEERLIDIQPKLAILSQIQNIQTLTTTEKQQIISARIGQGIFRRNLIIDCGFCPITLIDDANLLIASHIK